MAVRGYYGHMRRTYTAEWFLARYGATKTRVGDVGTVQPFVADASSPAPVRSGAATTSTAAFTPATPCALIAFAQTDQSTGALDEQLTVSGAGLTWTLAKRHNGSPSGSAEIWVAYTQDPIGSVTVDMVSNKGSVPKSLNVKVITGIDPVIFSATGSAAGDVTYISTVAGSWGWACGVGGNTLPVAGGGQTVDDETTGFDSGDAVWTVFQAAKTATPGTSVTMSVTGPSPKTHVVAIELVPLGGVAVGAQPPAPTLRRFTSPRPRRSQLFAAAAGQMLPPPVPVSPRRACRMPALARRTRFTAPPWPAAQAVQPPPFVPATPRRARLAAAQRRARIASAPADQPSPTTAAAPRRRLAFVLRRRPILVTPTDPQPTTGRPRTRFLAQARRGRAVVVVPTQLVVTAPAYPPQPVRSRIKGLRLTRGRSVQPIPAQDPAPGRLRQAVTRIAALRRGHPVTVVPAQAAPTPPPYPPQPVRTRLRGVRLGRGRSAQVVPDQVVVTNPPYPIQPVRTRLRGMRLARGRSAQVVPGQATVTPPPYPPQNWRARTKGIRPARGRTVQPVTDQTTAPPGIVRTRLRGIRPARSRYTLPVPPQDVVPTVRARQVLRRFVALRRGRAGGPPVAQGLPPLLARVRARLVRVFRGSQRAPVPPQIIVVPPPYQPGVRRTRRVLVLVARNRRTAWTSHSCIVGRPSTGTTTRPGTGTTAYNLATTGRPSTGTTTRPNTGTTQEPC